MKYKNADGAYLEVYRTLCDELAIIISDAHGSHIISIHKIDQQEFIDRMKGLFPPVPEKVARGTFYD